MKKILKIIGIGFILGILLLVIEKGFDIDSEVFMSYYWKIGIGLVLLLGIFNIIYNLVITNKLKKAMIYFEEQDYAKYIENMESILKNVKGKTLQNLIRLNLSAGYIENNEYDKGLDILNDVDKDTLTNEQSTLVYWLNKAIVYFRLGDYENFKQIINTQISLFEKYKNNENYGESLSQLKILNLIVDGEFKIAKKDLEKLRTYYTNSKKQLEYDKLEKIIEDRIKNI